MPGGADGRWVRFASIKCCKAMGTGAEIMERDRKVVENRVCLYKAQWRY